MKKTLLALITAGTLSSVNAALIYNNGIIVIDSFTFSGFGGAGEGAGAIESSAEFGDGTRELFLEDDNPGASTTVVAVNGSPLSLNTPTDNTTVSTLLLQWDAGAAQPASTVVGSADTTGASQDFNQGFWSAGIGTGAIKLDYVIASTNGVTSAALTLYSGVTNVTHTNSLNSSQNHSTFSFDDFAGIDFDNITAMELVVVSTEDIDLDTLSVVPEPSTSMLAVFGLAGFLGFRRRK